MVGMGGEADKLKVGMNHAAEDAVADAKPIFKAALQKMTLADAKGILTGGDDAGTQYFRRVTSASSPRNSSQLSRAKPASCSSLRCMTSMPARRRSLVSSTSRMPT